MEDKVKCCLCEEEVSKDGSFIGEEGTDTAGEPVCETCWCESEPKSTFFFSDRGEDDSLVVDAVRNQPREEGYGKWKVEWHNSGGYRGHYEVTPPKEWKVVAADCALSYSEDEQNLKKFDDTLQEFLKENGIDFVRVFSRTSNVFSSGYDFFVKKADYKKVVKVSDKLKAVYRDPVKFNITAITGADPKDVTPTEKLFALLGAAMIGKRGSGKK